MNDLWFKFSKIFKAFKIIPILIFEAFSLYPFLFFDSDKSELAFYPSVDGRLPFYPEYEVQKIWTVFNSNFSYGVWDTGWSFISKSLPIYLIDLLFHNHELTIKIYYSFLLLAVMVSMYLLLSQFVISDFVKIPLSILWAYQVTIKNYLITTPNIILFYAGFPLFYAGLSYFIDERKVKVKHFSIFVVGLCFMSSGDISYSLIGLLGGLFLVLFRLADIKNNFRSFFNNIFWSLLIFIAVSQIYLSGLIIGYFFNSYDSFVDNHYSKGVISNLPKTADYLSTLRLGTGQGDPRTSTDFISAFLTICILLLTLVVGKRSSMIRGVCFGALVGFIMAAGHYLPHWEIFYEFIYSLPFSSLVRNMFKFNFLYIFGVFVCSGFLLNEIFKFKDFFLKGLLLLIILVPFTNSSYKFIRLSTDRVYFQSLPSEYFVLKDIVNNHKNSRIFYYPLKDPLIAERYRWMKENAGSDMSQPPISNIMNRPDNIDTSRGYLEFDLSLIINQKNPKDLHPKSYTEFMTALGAMGYKYFVFRYDLPFYNEDSKNTINEIKNNFAENGLTPVYKGDIFEVYEVPKEFFVPVISAENYDIIEFDRGFNKVILRRKDEEIPPYSSKFKINTKKERTNWIIRQPFANNTIAIYLLKLDPIMFGRPVYYHTEVCNYRGYGLPNSTNRIGNCFFLDRNINPEIILVEFYPDLINRYLKITGMVSFVYLLLKYKKVMVANSL